MYIPNKVLLSSMQQLQQLFFLLLLLLLLDLPRVTSGTDIPRGDDDEWLSYVEGLSNRTLGFGAGLVGTWYSLQVF